MSIQNLWCTIKIDNNVSVFNPGGEMGRLVSMHEAPATPNVNPFLSVAKESENGECQVLNFCSPPGTERMPGAGVNEIKPSLNVNLLQKRDDGEPQQRGSGRRRVLPSNSFVNSWVERTRTHG